MNEKSQELYEDWDDALNHIWYELKVKGVLTEDAWRSFWMNSGPGSRIRKQRYRRPEKRLRAEAFSLCWKIQRRPSGPGSGPISC